MPPRPRLLASWKRRAAAAVIDGLILLALNIVFALRSIIHAAKDSDGLWSLTSSGLIAVAIIVLVTIFYTSLLPFKTNGQTIGKHLLKLRVVKLDGSAIDLGTMLRRYPLMQFGPVVLSNYLGFLFFPALIYFLVDYLWPLRDQRQQCLHDKVARTVVCDEREG